MKMVTGIYNLAIDEKGRIMLPSRMRQALQTDELVLLPGLDSECMMLMTPDFFENHFSSAILNNDKAIFSKQKRALIRAIISPAVYINADANGRIGVPMNFRNDYSLVGKNNVTLIGSGFHVEIWNTEVYEKHMSENRENISDLCDSLFSEE